VAPRGTRANPRVTARHPTMRHTLQTNPSGPKTASLVGPDLACAGSLRSRAQADSTQKKKRAQLEKQYGRPDPRAVERNMGYLVEHRCNYAR